MSWPGLIRVSIFGRSLRFFSLSKVSPSGSNEASVTKNLSRSTIPTLCAIEEHNPHRHLGLPRAAPSFLRAEANARALEVAQGGTAPRSERNSRLRSGDLFVLRNPQQLLD